MSRKVKHVIIGNIVNILKDAGDMLVVNMASISGVQANLMRMELRRNSLIALSVKSGLASVASSEAGRSELTCSLDCSATLVYGDVDLFGLCKETVRISSEFGAVVVGGLSGRTQLTSSVVGEISKGMSRREWIGSIVSSLLFPGCDVVTIISSPSEVLASQICGICDLKN